MSNGPGSVGAGRREVRLLVITIGISAMTLLLLAQLRFPEQPVDRAAPATPALERLAARATYGELARIIADVQRRIGPATVSVAVRPDPLATVPLDTAEIGASAPRFATAVRIDGETAVAALPPGVRPDGAPGSAGIEVLALDDLRGVAVLRVPSGAASVPRDVLTSLELPAYVAVAESTASGVIVRPIFVPRADAVSDPSWPGPVLALGALGLSRGSLLFSLDGEFLGLVASGGAGPLLVPARTIIDHAARLRQNGSIRRGAFGFSVQDLTQAVASATGAQAGVVVAFVAAGGPATSLRVGDVIVTAQGEPIVDLQTFAAVMGEPEDGRPVRLEVVRRGERHPVEFAAADPAGEARPEALGLTLRVLTGVGVEVVAVMPDGGGARAGLRAGDVITHLNGTPAPRPLDVERAWVARPDAPALLGIQRGALPLVLVFGQP
jgi:hypothetical protein